MTKPWARFLFLALLGLIVTAPAHAEERIALVIGNSAYPDAPLSNPANDARLIADTLRAVGFTLVGGDAQIDLNEADFRKSVKEFGEQLHDGDVGLFYYAGHGLQVQDRNYLVPIDANPKKEADVPLDMVDTKAVLDQMAYTRLNIVILDACRNNPFGGRTLVIGRGRESDTVVVRDWSPTNGGLAGIDAPPHTLIAFSTQPGKVALDGTDSDSPFAKVLADVIRKPGLGLFDTFNEVQAEVYLDTHQRQKPFVATDTLPPNFYFVPPTDADNRDTRALPASPVVAGAGGAERITDKSAAAESCNPPIAREDGWTVGTPSSVGLDETRLCALHDRLAGTSAANMHSILVARHGRLVFEEYFSGKDEVWGKPIGSVAHDADTIHDMRSISKEVISLLFGIALDRKLISSIDEPVFTFFPEYKQLRTTDKDRILLRHLLTMSSGLAWDETSTPYGSSTNSETQMLRSADPYKFVLAQPLRESPGAKFVYSGGAPMLLAGVIRKATGKSLLQFANEALFRPLGITDVQWIKMPNDEFAADSGLRLRPRDLAKVGQLILQHGQWQGRQIVSAEWIAQSTKPQIEATDFLLFGDEWWLGRLLIDKREVPWIAGMGLGGQRLFVVPALDLVVVTTAGYYDSLTQYSLPWEIFRQYAVRSVRDGQ